MKGENIAMRLRLFAAGAVRLCRRLPDDVAAKHITRQLVRAATGGGANYEEARGAESRADFIHKLGIVRKELNETAVWLKIVAQIVAVKPENIVAILQENLELARIISASIRTARNDQ